MPKSIKLSTNYTRVKKSSSETTGPILTRLGSIHPCGNWVQVHSNEGDCPFPRECNIGRVKIH
jgi:hypothetical protein